MSDIYEPTKRLEMLEFVPINARTILEIGCGRSLFARELKKRQECSIIAIEPDSVTAQEALAHHDKVIIQPVEQALAGLDMQFDCILMIDVLEHLVDPWSILQQLHSKLTPSGCIVASIPNMRYFHALKGLVLRREWEYDKSGVKDKTHLRFFTESSVKSLFHSQGYVIKNIVGINKIQLPLKWRILSHIFPALLSDVCFPQYACVVHYLKK